MLSKKYKTLQETREGLILDGEIGGCIIKEVTCAFGTEGGLGFRQVAQAQNTLVRRELCEQRPGRKKEK